MAMQIDAGKTGRGDLYLINPENIILGENGRWEDHTDESIMQMVRSYENDGGQIEPCEVRRRHDKRVVLTLGFRRYKAAMKYNELHPDTPMQLKCIVTVISEEEALIRNIVENKVRSETTVVDDAFNQRKLREQHMWTDAQIATRYDQTPSYVSRLKKLPGLRREILQMIHRKELPAELGFDLADMSNEDQDEVLAAFRRAREQETTPALVAAAHVATPPTVQGTPVEVNGEVGHSDPTAPVEVQQVVVTPAAGPGRGKKKGAGKGTGKPAAKKRKGSAVAAAKKVIREKKIASGQGGKSRQLAEVREFLEGLTGPAENPFVKDLADTFLKFFGGKISDEEMQEKIEEFASHAELAASAAE